MVKLGELEADEMNGYITVQEAAVKWGVTDRQVQLWCKAGRIPGATMPSRIWIIPENAERPSAKKGQTDATDKNAK
jgi:predicted site-specific integrase-resolvase